jgi:hypothetical protein
MKNLRRTLLALVILAFNPLAAVSSDHLDTAAVIADPAADIGDLYAWTDGHRLNLVMTIVGGKFSDHVRYEFHVDSGRTLGHTTATLSIACEFDSAFAGNALLGTFDTGDASNRRKTEYNQSARENWASYAADIGKTLAIYDGFDGVCGNQWLAVQNAAPAMRYDGLAKLLADDRLWVNNAARVCVQYLAAEFDHVGATHHDCGGRTPNYDAVDVFRSLLAMGSVAGVDDGVNADDGRPSDSRFPFLAPPTVTKDPPAP